MAQENRGMSLMDEPQPTLVAVYELVGESYRRMAEFRLTADGAVLLALSQPGCCPLAQRWHRDGIDTDIGAGRAFPEDGPAFLRALLRSRPMSYCRVVDESASAPTESHESTTAAKSPGLS